MILRYLEEDAEGRPGQSNEIERGAMECLGSDGGGNYCAVIFLLILQLGFSAALLCLL